jgi:zinc protease
MTPRRHVARAVLLGVAALASVCPVDRLSAQDFPTRPPAPTPLRPVQFPPFQETVLPNGMTLLLVENHEQPVLSLGLSFRAGSSYDPVGKEGLSAIVAEVLTKGTPDRTAEQIAAAIEGAGGTLSATSTQDFLTVSADVLSDQAELAFNLLGDVTRRPTLPPDELELARTRYLSSLEVELSQPENVAARVFGREIYGRHPYGRSTSPASYRAITRPDVVIFMGRRVRPAGALLVVAGDITLSRARVLAVQAFGTWRGAPAPTPPPPPVPLKTRTDIVLVHRPGSVQSNVVLGNTTFFPTDTGYYAARLATQVLGGGADARLFLILREQKSWTYGSYASLQRYRGMGHWQATFEGRTAVTDSALAEMLRQVARIRTEAIVDSELAAAKGFLIGSFPLTIETPGQIAQVVTSARLLGLPPGYLRSYRERLAAVTPLRARAAARRTYHTTGLTIVVVGDATAIYEQLRAIAPVRLVDIDGKPIDPAVLHPVAGPVAFDRAQIVARRDSFEVLRQGDPFGFQVTNVQVASDSIVYTETTALGTFFQQRTTAVLNGADLAMRRMDQTGTVQNDKSEIHLSYADGKVTGTSVQPQGTGTPRALDVNAPAPPGVVDDNALNMLLPALPLAEGKAFNLNVFSSGEGVTKTLTVRVAGVEDITVPAGKFNAYRLELSGMQIPIVMFVGTESPRRLLRIAPVGAPLVFQLVK